MAAERATTHVIRHSRHGVLLLGVMASLRELPVVITKASVDGVSDRTSSMATSRAAVTFPGDQT